MAEVKTSDQTIYKVVCPKCRGTGNYGFMPCYRCKGTGKIEDAK